MRSLSFRLQSLIDPPPKIHYKTIAGEEYRFYTNFSPDDLSHYEHAVRLLGYQNWKIELEGFGGYGNNSHSLWMRKGHCPDNDPTRLFDILSALQRKEEARTYRHHFTASHVKGCSSIMVECLDLNGTLQSSRILSNFQPCVNARELATKSFNLALKLLNEATAEIRYRLDRVREPDGCEYIRIHSTNRPDATLLFQVDPDTKRPFDRMVEVNRLTDCLNRFNDEICLSLKY